MAALRGERFHIDLSDDEASGEAGASTQQRPGLPSLTPAFVKDIQEKRTSAARPPQAPSARQTSNGFPSHRKRFGASKFKQARAQQATEPQAQQPSGTSPPPPVASTQDGKDFEARERREIDAENKARLAKMSPEEIEQERHDLMSGLSPALLQRLLKRSNIEEDQQLSDFPALTSDKSDVTGSSTESMQKPRRSSGKRVAFAEPENDGEMPDVLDGHEADEDAEQEDAMPDILDGNITAQAGMPAGPGTAEPTPPSSILTPAYHPFDTTLLETEASHIHFPRPDAQIKDLDPTSPTFLTDLHKKYYPTLSADPSKLAWMTAPTASENSAYSPSNTDLPINALRFAFDGRIVPPSEAANIPVNKGLHHHGDAPGSAGYTISELAHLARSSFPGQRCVAFQTLGRILYRLGIGEFRRGAEGDSIERGLWACVREGRVLDTLREEAERPRGHLSAKAYAVDALWLWRQGGGLEPVEDESGGTEFEM